MADPTPKQRHREDAIRRAMARQGGVRLRCDLAHRGGCSGKLEADHPIEVSWIGTKYGRATSTRFPAAGIYADRLRVVTFDELVADGRNSMILCARGHHEPKTRRLLDEPITADEIPPHVFEFVEWFGFEHRLEGLGSGVVTA